MDSRKQFEEWLMEVHGLDSEWQEERNCFKDFPAHLAYQAWQASRESLLVKMPKAQTAAGNGYIESVRHFVELQGIRAK